MNTKEVVEILGGKYLFGGALIQFGENSFKEMYKQIYDAAMLTERKECANLCDALWQDDKTAYDCREAIIARGLE